MGEHDLTTVRVEEVRDTNRKLHQQCGKAKREEAKIMRNLLFLIHFWGGQEVLFCNQKNIKVINTFKAGRLPTSI